MEFKDILTNLRKSRGLSQRKTAKDLGMALLVYQRYEWGEHEPAFRQLIALADYFDVSLDELCGRERKACGSSSAATIATPECIDSDPSENR